MLGCSLQQGQRIRVEGFRTKQPGREELVLFSYNDVLIPPKQQALVTEALTQEALEITRQLRTDAFSSGPVHLALTGKEVAEKTMADAVHMNPPRAQLHYTLLASEGLTYDAVGLTKHPTQSGYRLTDPDLAERIHRENVPRSSLRVSRRLWRRPLQVH